MAKVRGRRRPKVAILEVTHDRADFETDCVIRGVSLGVTIPASVSEGIGLKPGSRVRVTVARRD